MSASGGASEAVLKAFKRFDADGSGSVSREELSSILKTLDDTFDDEAIDGLLVLADASGDGELQIEEFLRWIFVEDQGSLGAAISGVHDITMRIAGCSCKKCGISNCRLYTHGWISFSHTYTWPNVNQFNVDRWLCLAAEFYPAPKLLKP